MKYIYGPVKSRRIGFSLGLSLTPYKICNFDCVYCQLGKTTEKTSQRKEYVKIQDILEELRLWLVNNPEETKSLDYITLSGAGEPTLNIKIADLIREIKKLTNIPVAVITNSSLLPDAAMRRELLAADLIVPSLDSVNPKAFAEIDCPAAGINVEDVINGLIALRKEFRGKIWLEVMLVKGLNDDIRQIKKLKEVIDRINPDKIQINSPVRTARPNILSVDKGKLNKIKEILGDKAEII